MTFQNVIQTNVFYLKASEEQDLINEAKLPYEHRLAVYRELVSQCCYLEGLHAEGNNDFQLESFAILTKSPVTECLEDKKDENDQIKGDNAVAVI